MALSPDRWEAVERLYHAALAQPDARRAAFLAGACAGDEELRREVESLLVLQVSADAMFTRGAAVAAARLASDGGQSKLVGRRIGAYQILGHIGAGGMGEVYRARDTRLGREVAIKILPRAFTQDADRLARFEREARVLASLNHPHIGAIYGLEEAPTDAGTHVRALILELVEGETLAERIARTGSKGLPIREALDIAHQIADALDAAHEKGIVHRDLKPANIKITPQGVAKVLDFGLAKLDAGDKGASAVTEAPTITVNDTREGLVFGTAAYMSPEQARGQAVDKRTDIWAFGCVLYEMLAGSGAFARATVTDTLAAVVERDPDWTALPPTTPANLRWTLTRCLVKDPRRRLRDIADAGVEPDAAQLRDTAGGAPAPSVWRRPRVLGAVLMVAVASAAVTISIQRMVTSRAAEASPQPNILVQATADTGVTADPALSNDGTLLAYSSDRAGADNLDIWVQQTAGSTPLRLTDDPIDEREPAFSPDGSRIAYRSERDGGGIYLVPTLGGQQPRLLVPAGRRPRFSPDGSLVAYWTGTNVGFASNAGSYRTFVVSVGGGSAREVENFTGARYPVWAPDGHSLLLLGSRAMRPLADTYDWWQVPLDGSSPIPVGARALLEPEGIPFQSGDIRPDDWHDDRVVFSDGRYLWRLRFDRGNSRVSNAQRLTFGTNVDFQATAAATGAIAFASAAFRNNVWALPIDAASGATTGSPRQVTTGAGEDARPSASRDGQLVAYVGRVPKPSIFIKNLQNENTIDVGVTGSPFGPAISPDGKFVAYEEGGGVALRPTRGGAQRIVCERCAIGDWVADSTAIVVVRAENNAGRLTEIRVSDGQAQDLIVSTDQSVSRPFPSPDGRLLAFRRTGSEGDAILVAPRKTGQSVPTSAWVQVVAPEEDTRPCGWSPDGALLYFVSGRDGTRCLYAQRLDRTTGTPVGEPFAVRHFHGSRNVYRSGANVLSTGPANALAGGFFFYDISDLSANVWLMPAR